MFLPTFYVFPVFLGQICFFFGTFKNKNYFMDFQDKSYCLVKVNGVRYCHTCDSNVAVPT